MYTNQVWTLIDPSEMIKPVGYKWVFKTKTNMDDDVKMYKVILVVKGYKQR